MTIAQDQSIKQQQHFDLQSIYANEINKYS